MDDPRHNGKGSHECLYRSTATAPNIAGNPLELGLWPGKRRREKDHPVEKVLQSQTFQPKATIQKLSNIDSAAGFAEPSKCQAAFLAVTLKNSIEFSGAQTTQIVSVQAVLVNPAEPESAGQAFAEPLQIRRAMDPDPPISVWIRRAMGPDPPMYGHPPSCLSGCDGQPISTTFTELGPRRLPP